MAGLMTILEQKVGKSQGKKMAIRWEKWGKLG